VDCIDITNYQEMKRNGEIKMEFVIVIIVALIATIVLKYVFDYKMKELKHIGDDEELDNLAKVYPSNIQMCQEYLKKLGNEKVEIEENKGAEASLYIAITNKILIANIREKLYQNTNHCS